METHASPASNAPSETHFPAPDASPDSGSSGQPEFRPRRKGLLRFTFALTFVCMALTFADVIVWEGGIPKLNPKRLRKLEREKKEILDAEQYALVAIENGWYPCYNCFSGKIYLYRGNIWKYGVTRKGEILRYGKKFASKNKLSYVIEFQGNYALCLMMEKDKLYLYPLLKENMDRPDSLRLVYPPGNTQDK